MLKNNSASLPHCCARIPQQVVLILLIILLISLLSLWMHPRMPTFSEGKLQAGEITLTQLITQRIDPIWVDARSSREFSDGHIPGAVNISEDDWEAGLGGFMEIWDPDRTVVVYCAAEGCQASKAVAMRLQRELMITNIFHLQGGWEAWNQKQN